MCSISNWQKLEQMSGLKLRTYCAAWRSWILFNMESWFGTYQDETAKQCFLISIGYLITILLWYKLWNSPVFTQPTLLIKSNEKINYKRYITLSLKTNVHSIAPNLLYQNITPIELKLYDIDFEQCQNLW